MNIAFHEPARGASPKPVRSKWPPQGQWTYEDYCRLPEDGWIYEVIEGELLMSQALRTLHQRCKGKIFAALLAFTDREI